MSFPAGCRQGALRCLPARGAPRLQTFHIEAGDATLTLNEFSRQSSLQLLFDYNIVRGRKTRAVSGEYEASAALRQMLVDTGLVFDFVNDRTLAVTLLNHDGAAGSATADAPSAVRRTVWSLTTLTTMAYKTSPSAIRTPTTSQCFWEQARVASAPG